MKYKKVIAAGHICLDITPVFPENGNAKSPAELLIPGRLINVKPADVHTGGSVANTGLALKILGNDVCLMGKVGDDAFGGMVQRILGDYGAGGLIVDKNSSTSYSVVLALPQVDRIFLHDPAANDTFAGSDVPDAALEDAALFHFGYPPLMKKMYENNGTELKELFARVKKTGIATSLDMAAVDPASEAGRADWYAILKNVLPYVDFFVPSFEELCFMLDREKYEAVTEAPDMERDVKPLAEKALSLGCGAVLIKCGTAGMYFVSSDMKNASPRIKLDTALWANKEFPQPCFKAELVRSATGAGDASIAAFLSAVLRGKSPEECVALAAAEGACAVTSYDALGGLKSLEELEEKIAAGWETN